VLSKITRCHFFASGHRLGYTSRVGVEKIFFDLTFLPDTATQRQVIDFFYHHDLAKILFTSIC